MLKIKQFAFNDFGVNTYLLYDTESKEAIVVDPGMSTEYEYRMFDDYVSGESLRVTQVVNTHMHLDHCFGDNYVRDKYGVKVAASASDKGLGESLGVQGRLFGIGIPSGNEKVEIDVPLKEGDRIAVGEYTLEVIEVSGHSQGGLVLYCPAGGFAIVGDSIFQGSIGRTDLAGGDHASLIENLRRKVLTLPEDTQLLPGHGGFTTVGREKRSNPYL